MKSSYKDEDGEAEGTSRKGFYLDRNTMTMLTELSLKFGKASASAIMRMAIDTLHKATFPEKHHGQENGTKIPD